jgi:acetyl esterase
VEIEPVAASSVAMDPELVALSEAARSRGLAPLWAISPEEARDRIVAGNQACAGGPELDEVGDVQIPVSGGGISLRIYRSGASSNRTLLYLHGGGWITGELGYADEICRFLARDTGTNVVSADYRLAPEHRFPVALEDAYAALLWTADNVSGDGVLGIAGDSAGGNLAAACAAQARGEGGPRLALQVLIYPVVDHDFARPSYRACANAFPLGRADLEYCFDQYVPDRWLRDDQRVSPIRLATHAGLPPAIVVVAGHDPLHDEGVDHAARLVDGGVPVTLLDFPSLSHGFLRFTGAVSAAAAAREQITSALEGLFRTCNAQAAADATTRRYR